MANTFMRRRLCMLPVVCTAASAFQQGSTTLADLSRRADVYAIYSLMLKTPPTSHGPYNSEIYLISDTTAPGTPKEPCVRVPSDHEASFAEVMMDYNQRKDSPRKLEPAFTITKPFRLLNSAEVDEFIQTRFHPTTEKSKPNELFEKASDLFRLTDVYFNRNRTLALTAISTWCGALCALMQWKVFEKTKDGKWEERSWISCSTIA